MVRSATERYHAEQAALYEALGDATEGGVLSDSAHIGSTSIANLEARPCIDIALRVHPYPLSAEKVEAVTDLGFTYLGEQGLPGQPSFRKGPDDVHLHVVSFESGHWARYLVFRDYLRANTGARHRYEVVKRELAGRYLPPRHHENLQAYQGGKAAVIELLEEEAFTWHVETTGFVPVTDMAEELEGLSCPWFVSSGWALDLFVGKPSRYHDDVDIVAARDDQSTLQRHLLAGGWRLFVVVAKGEIAPWQEGATIAPSSHQVHAYKAGMFLDLLFEPHEADHWVFRSDPDIRMPLSEMGMRFEGIPFLAPEIVLLFKRRSSLSPDGGPRDKDQADFERLLPKLGAKRRTWLRRALSSLSPGHPWSARLR